MTDAPPLLVSHLGTKRVRRHPRPAILMVDRALEALALVDGVPWADRRLDDRLRPRPSARAETRRPGAGDDFADGLLDVSERGIGVRISLPVRRGERFHVTLWGPDGERCGRGVAVVRWAAARAPGDVLAGLKFDRPLPARMIRALADGQSLAPLRLARY